jgi:Uma2 family endonuclease
MTTAAVPAPIAAAKTKAKRKRAPSVPEALVKEIIDGIPFYHKGYKNVLSGKQNPEEIMGASGIQSLLVSYLYGHLYTMLNRRKYWLLISELGSNLDKRNNLSFDLAIFNRSALKPQDFDLHYLKIAPRIVIEVDTGVDTSDDIPEHEYIYRKTRNLLEFGTEKIIWIFTRTQQVTVVTSLDNWTTFPWKENVEVLDDVSFNIAEYLEEEGIDLSTALNK